MSRFARPVIAIGYLLALAVLAADAFWLSASLETIVRSNDLVYRSRMILHELERTLSLLKDAETGQRGYLLTESDDYLGPFRTAEAELGEALRTLRELTSDNDRQRPRIDELDGLASAKMAELKETIGLGQNGKREEALRIVKRGRGKDLMDRARVIGREIEAEADRRLNDRLADSRGAVRRTMATFTTTTGLALALLAGVSLLHRRDAATRERAASAVRRSEAWLSTTLTSIGDAVIAADGSGHVTFLNPIARGLTGWSQEEAAGRPMGEVFRIINEASRLAVENPADRVIREGVIVGLANHTLLIHRDGTETPIDDSAAPIRNDRGEVVGVVLVFRDITDRSRQEASADEQRRLAEFGRDVGLALTESPDLPTMLRRCAEETVGHLDAAFARIWTLDESGETLELRASAGLYTHLDGPHARVPVGQYKIGMIARDRRPHLTNSVVGDALVPAQEWAAREGLVSFAGYPLIVEDRLVGVWAMFARRALSPATLGAMESVANGIALGVDRRRAEEAMRAAKEEADQANRAKTQFLAVLSHELRTPLNPILLAVTSMLERPTSPEDFRGDLEMIRQNVRLQSRLIDDLLDVMRIVRGKMPLHWEVADAHALIRHSIQICRSEVFGKGLRMTVELEAGRHHLNADPVRLQQVLWNLIKNAVKFTPKGGSIAIRTRNESDREPRGDRLVIEVADSGIGIEADVLGKIFDPFQQGESSITRRFGGLGLGLAITKGIVDGHGGLITVRSEGRDRGTTFRIDLRALPEPAAEENGRPARPASEAEPESPRTLKILVVEDEEATRRLMARLLRNLGHEVTTAGTIAEAFEEERAGEFGLIVSDIGLPDGSGLELMRRVVSRRGPVPAIALTGYGMEEDIQRSREAGFTAHMTKPIDFTKLEAMIRQVAT